MYSPSGSEATLELCCAAPRTFAASPASLSTLLESVSMSRKSSSITYFSDIGKLFSVQKSSVFVGMSVVTNLNVTGSCDIKGYSPQKTISFGLPGSFSDTICLRAFSPGRGGTSSGKSTFATLSRRNASACVARAANGPCARPTEKFSSMSMNLTDEPCPLL